MARVIELLPGKDNRVRVVRLRTSHGELLRPIQRVYPLEVSSRESFLSKDNYQKKVLDPEPESRTSEDPVGEPVTRVLRSGREIKPVKRLNL